MALDTTHTIAAGLQRQVFMDRVLREFKYRILPVTALSMRFNNVPLEGTDKLEVPFYPLATDASKDFDKAVGYVFSGTTNTDVREVIINKRKYLPITWTSQDMRRQPMFNPEQLAVMMAEKLAKDVLDDIFSVVTVANFGAAPLAAVDATAMNWATAMDMKDVCDKAMWPSAPRGLILDSTYANNLFRDPMIAAAYSFGEAGGVATGERKAVSGFVPYSVPVLPDNGEKLVGMAVWPSAAIIGFSPIRPTPEVEKLLTAYELVTDPDTGLTLEYRRGGDPVKDISFETIEVNYGYAKGQASALKRIVSP